MIQPVVVVDDVSVSFEVLSASHRFGWRGRPPVRSEVHALKNVNFVLNRGESVGVVGHNGAGKSTLMRVIAGLLPVTAGTVKVRHQPHMLGVQAALIGKLSGFQNIELGLLANEVHPDQIAELAIEVAGFTQLDGALKNPVRTYSNGMRARLAFAIATVRVPEVLLLDEALAVGDRVFKQRSLERMREIRSQAGTILIASHNLGEISATCDRAIWMHRGELIEEGGADEVLELYREGRS